MKQRLLVPFGLRGNAPGDVTELVDLRNNTEQFGSQFIFLTYAHTSIHTFLFFLISISAPFPPTDSLMQFYTKTCLFTPLNKLLKTKHCSFLHGWVRATVTMNVTSAEQPVLWVVHVLSVLSPDNCIWFCLLDKLAEDCIGILNISSSGKGNYRSRCVLLWFH